jgi:acetyl esterase/lipase
MSYLQPPSIAQTRASAQQANRQAPPGVPIKYVDANGVPAQLVCAPLASEKRVILYLHGGGFVAGLNDTYQIFAGMLSQVTGACVLLPDYRLAPEHPFPAALDDCLRIVG